MRPFAVLLVALSGTIAAPQPRNDAKEFEPLLAYQGTWQVSRAGATKPDTLSNKCSMLGQFFACAQDVNGQPSALVIFIRHGDTGHYQMQTVMPSGRATGLTDLQIDGQTWTYLNRQNQNGATTYFKTVNVFSGKNKIHFESSHSSNGRDYTVDSSGDEVRVTK